MIRSIFVLSLLMVLGGAGMVAAQSTDDFTVSLVMGVDTATPTVPTTVLTTPVATDQIDISWTASNDDIAVSGYQVYRDSVQIATTSLTTYSDTGLVASTTYGYEIIAFDTSSNFSATSTLVATTTFSVTATTSTSTPASGGGGGGSDRFTMSAASIDIATTTATISFTTSQYVRSVVRWGRTNEFEAGYSATDIRKKDHRILITNLEPGTTYQIEIVLTDTDDVEVFRDTYTFVTTAGPDVTAPANVMSFEALLDTSAVALRWVNPADDDFSYVRIVRNDRFYPRDSVDGLVIYEGPGEQARDSLPPEGRIRYYTAFSYDQAGNISSGAVTQFTLRADGGFEVGTTTTDIPAGASTTPNITFIQPGGGSQTFKSNQSIVLSRGAQTKISIPYNQLPEHLKTIVVTLVHPHDTTRIFSFLLKVNADRTAYEGVIGSLPDVGLYNTYVEIYDFKTERMTRIVGAVYVDGALPTTDRATEVIWLPWWYWILVVLGVFGLCVLYRKTQQREDSDTLENDPSAV